MQEPSTEAPAVSTTPQTPLALLLLRWLGHGTRCAFLRKPDWQALPSSPALILGLITCSVLTMLALQRLSVVGPATFFWQPLLAGWAGTALAAWGCYALLHHPDSRPPEGGPSASQLFCMLVAQSYALSTLYGTVWAVAIRSGDGTPPFSQTTTWALWIGLWVWLGAAQTLTLLRGTRRKGLALAVTVLLLAIAIADNMVEQRMLWIGTADAAQAPYQAPRQLKVTQELMEAQPGLLTQRLDELQEQRPGVVDLYALTFAPYAHEDVFRRESQMVAEVLNTRFDTSGRSLQLVNHLDTLAEWPWATPLNLQRAIQHLATLMDKEEDILLIHLTSHGAQNGELAAQFWPLTVDAVTPGQLKTWLDAAGIRHRVVSVSACYSGTWVSPLADENTLVMTAADSEHTSFGCGRQSELTYFGRAVYDEQLRLHTRSFEQAHAAARPLIEKREQQAGKSDGYSNPLLKSGEGIRHQLELLRSRLDNS